MREESASGEFYKSGAGHIREVLARLEAIQPELDALLARWVELDAIGGAPD